MHPAVVPFFAVTAIYYVWRGYHAYLAHKERQLRNRIAYMLWSAAQHCS
jgi:hypothetical protein